MRLERTGCNPGVPSQFQLCETDLSVADIKDRVHVLQKYIANDPVLFLDA
jgi:hypothetical protein